MSDLPRPLPPELATLDPVPNTRFFRSTTQGRIDGGLFSLDGVHPTTSAYGIVAREVVRIMDGDPGVVAGVFVYDVHPCRGFPGDALAS